MKPLSANDYASEAQIVAEFNAGEAALAGQLLALRDAPGPELETRIQSMAAAAQPRAPAAWRRLRQPQRWAAGALALAVVLAVALAVAGPQRVLAQFQRLLGYVPGVGFVDLDATRVLTAPVQLTREGVTLRVTQVLAQPNGTVVLFEAEGLPAYLPEQVSQLQQTVTGELRLPDGTVLAGTLQSSGRGADRTEGSLRFAPLPAGVYQVTLLLDRLPYVEPGDAPEVWEVPLTLRLATGEVVAELFPQPYVPVGAEDTQHGITLRVLASAHAAEATVLRLQAEWADPSWRFGSFTVGPEPRLQDDLGHSYGMPAPGDSVMVQRTIVLAQPQSGETLTPDPSMLYAERDHGFASMSPSATQFEIMIESVVFDVPLFTEFEVDLGPEPLVGDSFPMDVAIDVGGVQATVTRAWLERNDPLLGQAETWLYFHIDAPPAADGRAVYQVSLRLDSNSQHFSGGLSRAEMQPGRIEVGLLFRPNQPLPSGPVRIQVGGASLSIPGPWRLAWEIPGRAHPAATPLTLRPADAAQTRAGLMVRAEAVTLTDRVTVVQLALADAGAGNAPRQIVCWLPGQDSSGCWLEDNRGLRYAQPDVGWLAAERPLADTLVFDVAQPLARSMTLLVPAVEVAVEGAASFEVEVPPEAVGLALNETWPVDIALQVAGQSLRFVEARLVKTGGVMQLVLKTGALDSPRDRWLTGLRLAAITGPDGQPVAMAMAGAQAGPDFFTQERAYVASVVIPVSDAAGRAVRPGLYRVEMSGVYVAVRGPWELRWDLP